MSSLHQMPKFLLIALAANMASSCNGDTSAGADELTVSTAQTSKPKLDTRDIAGITLGKETVIPECRKEKAYGMILYATNDVIYPCFQDSSGAGVTLKTLADFPRGPEHNGNRSIELGSTSVPRGVSSTATVMLINGKPEQVVLHTEGQEAQLTLYALLVAKYGEPTYTNISQLQNQMGASYQGVEADWELTSMSVQFRGIDGRATEGYIAATTPAGTQFHNDRQPKHSDSL